ncbi:MAG: hypothetical protein GWP08_14075 [Nitrospiraceae bacterium]|nr:hypothetical protein [Nitrospiraceae bacterium]
MDAASHSLVCRGLERLASGSCLIRFWRTPEPSIAACDGSRLLPLMVRTRFLWWLLAAAAVALAIELPPGTLLSLALLAAAGLFAFYRPAAAVLALPLALIWVPRIYLVELAGEPLFARLDHALLAGILLRSMWRFPVPFRGHPTYVPLVLFLTACALSILVGVARDTLPSADLALLYFLQIAGLSLVFVAAYSSGPRVGRWGLYAWALVVIAAAAYGVTEQFFPLFTVDWQVYRTFERDLFSRQANHVAGLLAFAVPVGIALATQRRWRVLGLCLAGACCAGLAGTRSREAAVALTVALGTLVCLRFPRWTPVAVALGVFGLLLVPTEVWRELTAPGSSMHDRLLHWKSAVSTVTHYPVLGIGLGARHRSAYDNHYIMLLAETGLAGLALFVAWLLWLARALWQRAQRGGVRRALCLGVLAGLAGVAVQSMAAICFSITVIAGPVLWLSGYALAFEDDAV